MNFLIKIIQNTNTNDPSATAVKDETVEEPLKTLEDLVVHIRQVYHIISIQIYKSIV